MMGKGKKYEFVADYRGDISALGFGDMLQLDYCQEDGRLRVSVYQDGHWQDETIVSLTELFSERHGEEKQ